MREVRTEKSREGETARRERKRKRTSSQRNSRNPWKVKYGQFRKIE